MAAETVSFTAPLRRWHSEGSSVAWLPIVGHAADAIAVHELERRLELGRRGFGSVKVEAAVGASRWATSVFPQKDGSWFMAVKKTICQAEALIDDEPVTVTLVLL